MQTTTNIIGMIAALVSILIAGRPGHGPVIYSGNAVTVPEMHVIDCGTPTDLQSVGRYLLGKNGCSGCHSIDGSVGTGPSLRDVAWSRVQMDDGSITLADDAYLRESILKPQQRIVYGFSPAMPSFTGRLSERELTVIIDYIRSISRYDENAFGSPTNLPNQ